jgi:hypothetical protein
MGCWLQNTGMFPLWHVARLAMSACICFAALLKLRVQYLVLNGGAIVAMHQPARGSWPVVAKQLEVAFQCI